MEMDIRSYVTVMLAEAPMNVSVPGWTVIPRDPTSGKFFGLWERIWKNHGVIKVKSLKKKKNIFWGYN